MKEEIERYIELAVFLRDPNNATVAEHIINDVLDEMDALWYSTSREDHLEIERLVQELK